MGFIDGVASFFENLSTKWESITKALSNWFASSFPGLAKMFGIEASTKPEVKPGVKKEEGAEEKKKEEEKRGQSSDSNDILS